MNRDKKIVYIFSISIFVVLTLAFFIPNIATKLIISLVLLPIAILTICLIKKRGILSINKRQVTMLMIVIGAVYLMGYYLTGLHFGYYKATVPFSVLSLLKNILPLILISVSIELIRSTMLQQESKLASVFTFLSCFVLDVIIHTNINAFNSFNGFMDFAGLYLFPAISLNIMYHYLSKHYGHFPNIIYRLFTLLYAYIIPFVPGIDGLLLSIINGILPLLIYGFIKVLYEKKKKVKPHKSRYVGYACSTLVIAIMVSIVMLISGQFKYSLIVVGSESMTGEINKGDAVIYERYDDQIIQEGQVIVFKKDDLVIIHRVVDIKKINNQVRYFTKGDANENIDEGYVLENQIIGITNIKIAYIGYPTLWLRDLFSNN